MSITVNKYELQKLFELIIKKLSDEDINNVSLDIDYYWRINPEQLESMYDNPTPIVGSLIDDWENLKQTINKNQIFTYVDFDRVAALLYLISEKLCPSKESTD